MQESIRKADILIEALPYIQAFHGTVMVAKYGGSAIDNPATMRGILQDLIFLRAVGIRAVLVHGGGPMITRKLSSAGKNAAFIEGMRVTDHETIHIVTHELEFVNTRLVEQVKALGGAAEGVLPRDGVILAQPHGDAARLGFVGSVQRVDVARLERLFERRVIPIIAPLGVEGKQLYNINADHVASGVAAHL